MWKVRNIGETIVNAVIKYTEGELKIREATNDEPWGPHGGLLKEISQMTFLHEEFGPMMEMLFSRLKDNDNNWRRVYKGLLVVDYLIKNGSVRTIEFSRSKVYILRKIEQGKYVDDSGKDQSVNVNHRSSEIISLLFDENRLRVERNKSKTSSKRIMSMEGCGPGYYQNRSSNDHREDKTKAFRDSFKEAVTSVVDKLQNKIRSSHKEDFGDLQDEFKTGRYTDECFNDEKELKQRNDYKYSDYTSSADKVNFPRFGEEEKDEEFGMFVGSNTVSSQQNTVLEDIFSGDTSQSKPHVDDSLNLIAFDKPCESSQFEDIFSTPNTSNNNATSRSRNLTEDIFAQQISTSQTFSNNNQSAVHGTNSGINQQQNLFMGLDMQKQSSYYSLQQNQFQQPSPVNINSQSWNISSQSPSGFTASQGEINKTQGASSMQNIASKMSAFDDMIKSSLDSFPKHSSDLHSQPSSNNRQNQPATSTRPNNSFNPYF